jgi:TetR/AcrR family transcriptional repressor of nem operon
MSSPPSAEQTSVATHPLYSTFGGKHQLFVAALDRYRDTIVADLVGELEQAVSGRGAIQQFFTRLVDFFAAAHGWRGCLITNTACVDEL